MSRDEFASRYADCAQTLWCVAAAVLGSRQGAEDVVQEAAVVALSKLHDFQPGSSFEAWMAQIVRYVALNVRRKDARTRAAASDPAHLADPGAPPGHPPGAPPITSAGTLRDDQASFDDRLMQGLRTLSEPARACLLLRVLMGLSYREISRVLDIPEGTAMSHVHRSRRALREFLMRNKR